MVLYEFGAEGQKGVEDALKLLQLSEDLSKLIREREGTWAVFGKMNSHLYRDKLFKAIVRKAVKKEGVFMIFFLASVIKSRERILKAMENFTEEEKSKDWFYQVKDFYTTETTQYVSQANKNQKFPVVNIPTCMPGLDCLNYKLFTPKESRSMTDLCRRPTFSQLNLRPEVQTLAKAGYEYYWTKVIRGTKNPDKPAEPSMNEEFYQNAAGDKYMLLNADLTLLVPSADTGYTREEVENWLFDKTKGTAKGKEKSST